MFIQIIQGKCTRQDELRAMAEGWRAELSGGAVGWLGGTYGFTDDDQFIGVVRFESREAAMANSARPEQGAWAEKMMALMDGPGGVPRLRRRHAVHGRRLRRRRLRPDHPGQGRRPQPDQGDARRHRRCSTRCAPTSSAARSRSSPTARSPRPSPSATRTAPAQGEQVEPPPEVRAELESMMAGATFYDLHHPWFESA